MFAKLKSFIPKQNEQLPDMYGCTVHYIDGRSETFELASHYSKDNIFEFRTHEDIIHWVQMTNVRRVEFDKRFSKIVEIRQKMAIKPQE